MRKLGLLLILGLLAMLVSGCASLPNAGTSQVADRRVEYALAGNGGVTVVFESGLGGTMDWWAKVFPEISKNATAFAYNRPGYGKSDPVSTPRDGMHIVDELRTLLQSRNLKPPYVLVGHSLGGLYMQWYARRYPGEIAALVLVDSTHPDQVKGSGSVENWPAWARVAFDATSSAVAKEELNALDQTGEQVMSQPVFAGKPVIVLSALQPMKEKSALADDANAKRKAVASLYPGSRQIWVDSGHGIPLEKPEEVISAIRAVLPQ